MNCGDNYEFVCFLVVLYLTVHETKLEVGSKKHIHR